MNLRHRTVSLYLAKFQQQEQQQQERSEDAQTISIFSIEICIYLKYENTCMYFVKLEHPRGPWGAFSSTTELDVISTVIYLNLHSSYQLRWLSQLGTALTLNLGICDKLVNTMNLSDI